MKKDRELLWSIFAAYRATLDDQKKIEYVDAIRLAREHIEKHPGRAPWATVVVDETQDFGPEELKFIRALVPRGENDLFFVGDAHQRIYTLPTSMKECGIDIVGRSRKLRLNYRTTGEIRRYAVAALAGVDVDDLDDGHDDLKGYTSALSGPAPTVAWSAHKDDEVKGVLAALQALLAQSIDARDICVVARDNWQLQNTWAPALKEAGIAALQIESDVDEGSAGPGVRLCTMHRAKGLEFRHVFVVGLGDDRYPHRTEAAEDDPVAAGWEEARERSLFFVACTRARESLRVSGWGERKAGFIPG